MKLKAPIGAWRQEGRPKAKWHLLNPRRAISHFEGLTVCKRLVEAVDDYSKLSKLRREDVCHACLGPCEAQP